MSKIINIGLEIDIADPNQFSAYVNLLASIGGTLPASLKAEGMSLCSAIPTIPAEKVLEDLPEEEEKPKRKRRTKQEIAEEQEASTRSNRKTEPDEDDDERPVRKRRSEVDEDDEEEQPTRKRRSRSDDEDEDDRPAESADKGSDKETERLFQKIREKQMRLARGSDDARKEILAELKKMGAAQIKDIPIKNYKKFLGFLEELEEDYDV